MKKFQKCVYLLGLVVATGVFVMQGPQKGNDAIMGAAPCTSTSYLYPMCTGTSDCNEHMYMPYGTVKPWRYRGYMNTSLPNHITCRSVGCTPVERYFWESCTPVVE